MKSKPLKHKSTNTFRFKSFTERVSEIDIRHAALYQIEHANAEKPAENETHTHLTLRRWQHLNLTEGYKLLYKDLGDVTSVPQTLYRKDEILNAVELRLEQPDLLYLQPLLEIVVSLSKDLRIEFYKRFPRILELLVKLLDTKNGDQLEWTLICLAFLFKSLRQHLVRDINNVFKKILPLLSDSKHHYISNFAAESFAYVLRDIKDTKQFLLFMIKQLKVYPEATIGCGHLVFEMVRGVSGKFHSCAENVLSSALELLTTEPEQRHIIFDVLTQTTSDILQCINPKESPIFWKVFQNYIQSLMAKDGDESLKYSLMIVGQALEYRQCKFLTNALDFILVLFKVIGYQTCEEILKICSRIGLVILLSPNFILTQEHSSVLIRTLLSTPYPDILIDFVENTTEHTNFEVMILPQYIQFVISTKFDSDACSSLAKICIKKSEPCVNGVKLFEWVKYPIDLGKNAGSFINKMASVLRSDSLNDLTTFFILSSHVKNLETDRCVSLLSEFCEDILEKLEVYDDKTRRIKLFLLGLALESIVHISNFVNFKNICPKDKYLESISRYANDHNCLSALQTLDLYLSALDQDGGLDEQILGCIDHVLKGNLSSPYHEVRLVTTHIYSLFEKLDSFKNIQVDETNTDSYKAMSLCHAAECIKPSVQEYRSQVNLIQKLSYGSIQYNVAAKTQMSNRHLEYFFGIFHTNFKLLWEPVIDIIAGYANNMKSEEFWSIFYETLTRAFKDAKNNPILVDFNRDLDVSEGFVYDLYMNYNSLDCKVDFDNYRAELLQLMTSFVDVCEAKNRDLIVLFLEFIEEEYRKDFNKRSVYIDVLKHNKSDQQITQMEVDEVNESSVILTVANDNETQNDMTEELVTSDVKEDDDLPNDLTEVDEKSYVKDEEQMSKTGKAIFKTLLNIMQLLSKFKNPRALYKENVFNDLFMEFLLHKNSALQKYALECVLNYKNKSLTPYKDNLLSLVDDKRFKDELTVFKITKDADSINENDRAVVIPIVLRILYSKMVGKAGTDKKSGQAKRAFIMRQLAGCQNDEILSFVEMSFPHFRKYIAMDYMEIYKHISDNIDMKAVISPGKLHSTLSLIEVMREYFGGYMDEQLLPCFMKIYYSLCSILHNVLERSDVVFPVFLKSYKSLRVMAVNFIAKFLSQFEKYTWNKDELHIIFETLIWPLIPKLYIECVHTPTALLKLVNTWSNNPRYFILFTACKGKLSPLPEIFKLLNVKCHASVTNVILDMIERLLTLVENEEDKELSPIELSEKLDISVKSDSDMNYGSLILTSHVDTILDVLKRRFSNTKKLQTVNKRDLLILSRMTELLNSPETSQELLKLLVPILVSKISGSMADDVIENALATLTNLLNKSPNPEMYIKDLAILFNKCTSSNTRKTLCKMLCVIYDRNRTDRLKTIRDLVGEMNAYNARWLDQPDFEKRIKAFKTIITLSNTNSLDLDLSILIVHNAFYAIRMEKDIALRDCAVECMKKILPGLMERFKSVPDLCFTRGTVLSLIANGVKDAKNERHRIECLTILGELCRTCPSTDITLTDLSVLTCQEDREVDFFDNMCHLQMHRRVRALQRIVKVFKKCTKAPMPRTLTGFILPLASMYLCQEEYTDKNSLIDSCIDVVATCCRLLPWYHYELILKNYLSKLRSTDYRKQLTRLVVAILDAFHFDLSKCSDFELPKGLLSSLDRETALASSKPENEIEDEMDDKPAESTTTIDDVTIDTEEAQESEMTTVTANIESKMAAYDRIQVISQSVAKQIMRSLTTGLLPQLNRAISKLTEHDQSHKLNRRKTSFERQEEDIVKVPIALALVKLLQRLPQDIMKANLPSIFIKICSFLKSPLKQVRLVTREILRKIMLTIGPKHLTVLLEHLTLLLTRGFQVHVLVATLHTVLEALKDDLKPVYIDCNQEKIVSICESDIFGKLSEEKLVDKLGYKTPEAKPSKKSYAILNIVAQSISEKCFIELILPFKEILRQRHSKSTVLKVQMALANIATGLVTNKFVEIENLFVFSYGIASESIPELVLGAPKREITEKQRETMLRAKPDCFLIPEAPKKTDFRKVVTSQKANSHILVEFSLSLLHSVLKREKLPKHQCGPFVDPVVKLLADSLKSNHVKVTTVSLKCLSTIFILKLDTPSIRENIVDIVSATFDILHKYATLGINRQDENFLLVKSAFKCITSLTRHVQHYKFDDAQLRTLLMYVEEDLDNTFGKTSNSLTLLRTILDVRLECPELSDVMAKILKMAVVCENAVVREECRNLYTLYLSNYMLGKKLEYHIEMLTAQLNMELTYGRDSAIVLMTLLCEKLPVSTVDKHSPYLLISLGRMLVWENEKNLKEKAAVCAEAILKRLKQSNRDQLFQNVMAFLNENKPSLIELGAQLCSRFVTAESESFSNRLTVVLPRLADILCDRHQNGDGGKFVRLKNTVEDDEDHVDEAEKDHSIIQILLLAVKICQTCQTIVKTHSDFLDEVAQQCQVFLAHEHAWVRLQATRYLSIYLSTVNPSDLSSDNSTRQYIYCEPEDCLRSLVLDLCAQLRPDVTEELAEQALEVILQICKIVLAVPEFARIEQANSVEDAELCSKINIRWIAIRLRKCVNLEVARAPKSTVVRTKVFAMLTHLIALLETEDLKKVLNCVMLMIAREVTSSDMQSLTHHAANRVAKKIRRQLGSDLYYEMLNSAQATLQERRANRTKVILQERVSDPLKAAKRKLQMKERKKLAKKSKMETAGAAGAKKNRKKKRKLEDFDMEDSFLKEE